MKKSSSAAGTCGAPCYRLQKSIAVFTNTFLSVPLALCLTSTAILALTGCTGALSGGIPNVHDIVHPPQPVPFVYDGHVKNFLSWQDHSAATRAFTTALVINLDCDDPQDAQKADAILSTDPRQIVWWPTLFLYGGEGYELRSDLESCWAKNRAIIATYRSRSIAIWLLDEPADVAWSFWVDNGTRYDPNRYNNIITTASALVGAAFADLSVAYNVGSLPAGAVVAQGPTLIGLEAYAQDWQAKLQTLETLTPQPIWLMPPAFADGDPTVLDPIVAQRVRDEWAWAQHDTRVTGLFYFLQCITASSDCNDLTTGDKSSYTVGGGFLPLTRQALVDVGTVIRGH